ncbi:hypothetical protein J6590_029133 [Homalodisca vitripennis]|nr:hypothetical protein J6590_029133 [Homalodisca vitripennis]
MGEAGNWGHFLSINNGTNKSVSGKNKSVSGNNKSVPGTNNSVSGNNKNVLGTNKSVSGNKSQGLSGKTQLWIIGVHMLAVRGVTKECSWRRPIERIGQRDVALNRSPTARHGALRLQQGTSSATSLTPHWLLQGHAPNRLLPQLHSLVIPTVVAYSYFVILAYPPIHKPYKACHDERDCGTERLNEMQKKGSLPKLGSLGESVSRSDMRSQYEDHETLVTVKSI